MHRVVLFILMGFFAFAPVNAAESEKEIAAPAKNRTMEVSVNPIGGLFLGRVGGALKFKVADHVALIIPVIGSFWAGSFGYGNNNSASFTSWAIYSGLGARLYLSDQAFNSGWFFDTVLQVGYSNLDSVVSAAVINPYILGGYGWVFDSGMTIDLGLGIQYNFYTATTTDQPAYLGFPLPAVEASIGYAW